MDTSTFDAATKAIGTGISRRSVLRGLAAGLVATGLGAASLADEADARKRKRKNDKRCLRPGKPCQSSKQCCQDDGYVCAVASNAGNSDKTCSGGQGAVCGGANEDGDAIGPVCAARFRCSTGDPDAPGFEPFKKGKCLRDSDDM